MFEIYSIENNLLAQSELPLDISEPKRNNVKVEKVPHEKIKSKANANNNPIIRKPAKEKRKNIVNLAKKEDKIEPEEFQTIEEDCATTILPDCHINNLVLEYTGPNGTNQIEISNNDFVIGKDKSADAVIAFNPAISRRHCKITYENEQYYLQDMGSSNGTFLNKKPIKHEIVAINDGDRINLGQTVFIVKEL